MILGGRFAGTRRVTDPGPWLQLRPRSSQGGSGGAVLSLACHPVYPGIAAVGNQVGRSEGAPEEKSETHPGHNRTGACGSGTSLRTSSEAKSDFCL